MNRRRRFLAWGLIGLGLMLLIGQVAGNRGDRFDRGVSRSSWNDQREFNNDFAEAQQEFAQAQAQAEAQQELNQAQAEAQRDFDQAQAEAQRDFAATQRDFNFDRFDDRRSDHRFGFSPLAIGLVVLLMLIFARRRHVNREIHHF